MVFSLIIAGVAIVAVAVVLFGAVKIVRPTERAVIERLGKYNRFADSGLNLIVPFVEGMIKVNVTEDMTNVEKQEIITKDNLNAKVDLVVFYKVKESEEDIKRSLYSVNDFESQIVTLAQTTARNVIGDMVFRDVNSKRNDLNARLAKIMEVETKNWGVQIVRVELKEITPPDDVQETMNRVIKAENEKVAATDFATAKETEADGVKRAAIKEAEGLAQGRKIVADANAYKIKIENEAAKKYFKAEAKELKKLEVVAESLKANSKIVLGNDSKSILKLFDLNK